VSCLFRGFRLFDIQEASSVTRDCEDSFSCSSQAADCLGMLRSRRRSSTCLSSSRASGRSVHFFLGLLWLARPRRWRTSAPRTGKKCARNWLVSAMLKTPSRHVCYIPGTMKVGGIGTDGGDEGVAMMCAVDCVRGNKP